MPLDPGLPNDTSRPRLSGLRSLEIIGSYTGIAGALLVASNANAEVAGYALFTLASIALFGVFRREGLAHAANQQAVFFAINVFGLVRWSGVL